MLKLVIFTLFFCSSAEFFSPDATAPRRCRERLGHRPEHHDQVRAKHSERRSGQRPLDTTIKHLRGTRNGAAVNGLGTTIKRL
jgi:hypothetical protein